MPARSNEKRRKWSAHIQETCEASLDLRRKSAHAWTGQARTVRYRSRVADSLTSGNFETVAGGAQRRSLAYLKKAWQPVLDAVPHLPKEVLGVEVNHGQVGSLHGLDPLVRLCMHVNETQVFWNDNRPLKSTVCYTSGPGLISVQRSKEGRDCLAKSVRSLGLKPSRDGLGLLFFSRCSWLPSPFSRGKKWSRE